MKERKEEKKSLINMILYEKGPNKLSYKPQTLSHFKSTLLFL